MEEAVIIILSITTLVSTCNALRWKITTLTIAHYYVEKRKQCSIPDKKEMKECAEWAGKEIIRRLVRR